MLAMQIFAAIAIAIWALVLLGCSAAVFRGIAWKTPRQGDADLVVTFMLAGGVMALSSMVLFYPETARAMSDNETSWRSSIYLALAFVGLRFAYRRSVHG